MTRRQSATTGAARCPACGRAVDKLRAPSVAIRGGTFEYYCSSACKAAQLGAPDNVLTAAPPNVAFAPSMSRATKRAPFEPLATGEPREALIPLAADLPTFDPPDEPLALPQRTPMLGISVHDTRTAVLSLKEAHRPALLVGAAMALGLAGGTLLCVIAGIGASMACTVGALAAGAASISGGFGILTGPRSDRRIGALWPHIMLVAGIAATALWHTEGAAIFLACAALGVASLDLGCLFSARHEERQNETVLGGLRGKVRLLRRGERIVANEVDVEPGDSLLLTAGDWLRCDGIVRAPSESRAGPTRSERSHVAAAQTPTAQWLPFPGARSPRIYREDTPIAAGAQLLTGEATIEVTHVGATRAIPLALRGGEHEAATVTHAEGMAFLGTLAAMIFLGLAGYAQNLPLPVLVFLVLGPAFLVSPRALHTALTVAFARGMRACLKGGALVESPAELDRLGECEAAVFLGREAFLAGEPVLFAVEGTAGHDSGRMLGIAEALAPGLLPPWGISVRDALAQRQGAPRALATRASGLEGHVGLGVVGRMPTGERVVLGTRSLFLRERIALGQAHGRETEGHVTVLYVAENARPIGILALEDSLRPTARAAVADLLDAGIEPILMTEESREPAQALANAVGIDHVRAELPGETPEQELQELAGTRALICVIGHSAAHGTWLRAAEAAIAQDAIGVHEGFAVRTFSDDPREGPKALAIARAVRRQSRSVVAAFAITFGIAILCVAFALAAPFALPLVGLFAGGLGLALGHGAEQALRPRDASSR